MAEEALAHLLRTPDLFAEAKEQVTGKHFNRLNCYYLGEAWQCAKKCVEQQGAGIVTKPCWLPTLEQEIRQTELGTHVESQLFGDGQFNKGFFSRMAAMPDGDFEVGRGRFLLKQIVSRAFLVEPLRRMLENAKDMTPDELAEKAELILQSHRAQNVSGKPMFLTPAEFAEREFKIEWLIPKVLVAGQPCIVGGPSKSLKTSIMIDLAVSIGSGSSTRFLEKFAVKNDGKRVGFISGESGGATIQETFKRVCAVRGVDLAKCNVYPEFKLPKLGMTKEVQHMASNIRQRGLEVVIIDPIYLSLLAGNKTAKAPNVFDMGPLLADLSEACLEAGATPILVHHTVKHLRPPVNGMFEPLEREDLAMSGFSEFARQWLLINRRTPYKDGSGQHELWLRIGGSAGFGSLWGVDIKEGVIQDDFSGRQWSVVVSDQGRLKEQMADQKAQQQVLRNAEKHVEMLKRLEAALDGFPDGEIATAIRDAAGISKKEGAVPLMEELVRQKRAERAIVKKPHSRGFGNKTGYRPVNPFLRPIGAPISPPAAEANPGGNDAVESVTNESSESMPELVAVERS